MTLSRRTFLTGLTGATGTGLLGLAACGGSTAGSAPATPLTFWYWSGALSEGAVKDVAGRAGVTPMLIPGDFKQQLTTALASRRAVPDITGIKGEDMPLYLNGSQRFLDLNTLGAEKIAGAFPAAKYAQATTADGKQIGLPIDLGPTVTFLRADLWSKAGLPVEPAEVSAQMRTWDGWFEAAHRLKKALPGTFAIRSSSDVFGMALVQQPETFVTRSGAFAGDGGGVRLAWDLAVRSIVDGVQAGIYDGPAFNAALTAGTLTGHLGPAWNGLDLQSGAPKTSGDWRVAAAPGGSGNIGGSYLTLTDACREPEAAFAFISALLTPANEGRSFVDASVFPAVTAAYTLPALTRGDPFFGGQSTIEIYGPAVEHLPQVYESPLNAPISSIYGNELANIEGGKHPAAAWKDAVTVAARMAEPAAQ